MLAISERVKNVGGMENLIRLKGTTADHGAKEQTSRNGPRITPIGFKSTEFEKRALHDLKRLRAERQNLSRS
jgi:hypothetical protein